MKQGPFSAPLENHVPMGATGSGKAQRGALGVFFMRWSVFLLAAIETIDFGRKSNRTRPEETYPIVLEVVR